MHPARSMRSAILVRSSDLQLRAELIAVHGAIHCVQYGWEVLEALAAQAWDLVALDCDDDGDGVGPDGLQLAAMARTAGVITPFLFVLRPGDLLRDPCHPRLQPAACLLRPIHVLRPWLRRTHAT